MLTNSGSNGSGGGGGAGKATFSPLTVALALPTSLTDLLAETASGEHLKGIKIEGVTTGDDPQTFYELTLADVIISKTHEQNGTGDVLTFDNYSRVFLETHHQNPDGSMSSDTFGYDVKASQPDTGTAPVLTPGQDNASGSLSGGKFYLLIDGVDGGSMAEGHEGWFEIDSFNFDVTNSGANGSGGGGGAGKVTFSPLTVALALPTSLTDLLAETASGEHLKGIKIEGVTAGDNPQAFYELTLTDVVISKIHEQNGTGDVLTFDNYSRIFLETHHQNPDGSMSPADTFGFDVKANQPDTGTPPVLTPGHDNASGSLSGGKFYLLIDGVDGGSMAEGHEGWFEIDSFNFDASNSGSAGGGGGGGAGKVTFSPLTIGLALPTSLTDLLAETASGEHLKGIKIEGVTAGDDPQAFYELTLADVAISKTHEQNGTGDVLTFDNYSKIFLETHSQNPDGSMSSDTFGYDVKANQPDTGTAPVLTPGQDNASGSLSGGKFYLLIDGVDGGSTAEGHEGWFEIDGFNFDVTNSGANGSGGGGGAGKVTFSPLTVDLALPTSLTDLLAETASGEHLKEIKIEGVSTGDNPQAFYELTLADVAISKNSRTERRRRCADVRQLLEDLPGDTQSEPRRFDDGGHFRLGRCQIRDYPQWVRLDVGDKGLIGTVPCRSNRLSTSLAADLISAGARNAQTRAGTLTSHPQAIRPMRRPSCLWQVLRIVRQTMR